MNIHWKIFNVVNLICLALTTSFFVWRLGAFYRPLNDSADFLFYGILLSVFLAVIIDCVNNIFLTRLHADGRNLTLTRKICFWILLILFVGAISLFAYNTAYVTWRYFRYTGAYKPYFNQRYLMHVLSISVTGLYIIIMQIVLFFRIRSSYRQAIKDTISEIGSQRY